jgi:hypothetical protein
VTIPRIHYPDLLDKELRPDISERGYVTNISLAKEPKGSSNNDPVSRNYGTGQLVCQSVGRSVTWLPNTRTAQYMVRRQRCPKRRSTIQLSVDAL